MALLFNLAAEATMLGCGGLVAAAMEVAATAPAVEAAARRTVLLGRAPRRQDRAASQTTRPGSQLPRPMRQLMPRALLPTRTVTGWFSSFRHSTVLSSEQ